MCKSYSKVCVKCGSRNTKKDGRRKGRQSYRCNKCSHVWVNKTRKKTKIDVEQLYIDFSVHKQTYFELSDRYNITVKTVQKYLDMKMLRGKNIKPREIVLLVDTTYFGTFGLMLFKDAKGKSILDYRIVEHENNTDYYEGIRKLMREGWKIEAIVCDGKRGLLNMFPTIPTQMCHFHQRQIIRRYITKNPTLQPNKELNDLMNWFTRTDQGTFKLMLENWYQKHRIWLSEKGVNDDGKQYFVHRRTRSAYFSLKRNLTYLFTYLDYTNEIDIPNTSNGIESVFSHIKYKVNLHRGLREDRKIKLILSLLEL